MSDQPPKRTVPPALVSADAPFDFEAQRQNAMAQLNDFVPIGRELARKVADGDLLLTFHKIEEIIKNGCLGDYDGRKIYNDLESRRFKQAVVPPALCEVYGLKGRCIATRGNIVTIGADVKSGKSVAVQAALASVLTTRDDADCLGFNSRNPDGLAVVHIDTEQSPYDHYQSIQRALKRAGCNEPPPWFYSYCLTGLDQGRAKELFFNAVEWAAEKSGGIHSAHIDGVADLISDVNDAKESNSLVIIRACCGKPLRSLRNATLRKPACRILPRG